MCCLHLLVVVVVVVVPGLGQQLQPYGQYEYEYDHEDYSDVLGEAGVEQGSGIVYNSSVSNYFAYCTIDMSSGLPQVWPRPPGRPPPAASLRRPALTGSALPGRGSVTAGSTATTGQTRWPPLDWTG